MYCKYCGKPIDEGTMRCRICGRPVGPLEGGNGFWDLAEGKSPAAQTAEAQAAANDAAMKKLQDELDQLRKRTEELPAQKRSALPILAGLLGLLALAMGVFALFHLQVITGRLQALDRRVTEQSAAIAAQQATEPPQETAPPEESQGGFAAESKWKGLY